MMNKVNNKAGETLTETLVAMLIFSLVSVFFVNSVNTVQKMNQVTFDKDIEYQTAVKSAEIGPFGGTGGNVMIEGETIPVLFNEGPIRSYRIDSVNDGGSGVPADEMEDDTEDDAE